MPPHYRGPHFSLVERDRIRLNRSGMEPFDRGSGRERSVIRAGETGHRRVHSAPRPRVRSPRPYRACDAATGGVICLMVVFTPWAFGTTQDWSVWTMNMAGYVLGALLLAKWFIRQRTGYKPSRWGDASESLEGELFGAQRRRWNGLTVAMAVLTFLVLAYTLISALNARATYVEAHRRFDYHDCVRWLPHSYDRASTWNSLWMFLGLACFFWATRDWLTTVGAKPRSRSRSSSSQNLLSSLPSPRTVAVRESLPSLFEPAADPATPVAHGAPKPALPFRLRLVLWVLCINGSILALEAILQRLSGTNRLLWLVEPYFNKDVLSQFGPYAYRANAASYFNLVWPVCLGFWLVLRESAKPSLTSGRRLGSGNHIVLLPGAVLMAACPIISTSRGGTLIAVGTILITMGLLLRIARKERTWFKVGVCSLFTVILAMAAFLGLEQLVPRFQTIFTDQMSQRTEIYENAVPMAREFPVLGTGPGSFGSLYQFYRKDTTQVWHAYLHDDWLETRITFGWVGFSMILLMLALVAMHWFLGTGIPCGWELPTMMTVAIGGVLLHAKFDFPFQIYSIVLVFVLFCSILFSLSRKPQRE